MIFEDELYKKVAQLQATDDPYRKLQIVEEMEELIENYRSELLQDTGEEFPVWHNTYEYKRIKDILFVYWLCEPSEFRIRCRMDFIKANGETQEKVIVWQNPVYSCEADWTANTSFPVGLSHVVSQTDRFWNTGEIYKKDDEGRKD